MQTITSIETNVNLMIENVNNYSKMVFSDPNLQNLLRQGNVYSNLQTQSKVSAYLTNLMQAVPIIDSVYIYDNSGHLILGWYTGMAYVYGSECEGSAVVRTGTEAQRTIFAQAEWRQQRQRSLGHGGE
ncbi:hypothetical protein Q0F98_17700 [Paenibacillus amylolyticus]|nr:hypothetical protein Q0F98_17700 [Paenibacillus amylolyticus]